MRETVIGAVLGALFLGVLGYFGLMVPHTGSAADVEPGFVGVKAYGSWVLACGKPQPEESKNPSGGIPLNLSGGHAPAPSAQEQHKLKRCRTTLIMLRKDNPKQLVLILNLRYTVENNRLFLFARFPLIAQKGETVTLQVTEKYGLKLPVSECGQQGCIASGFLTADAQKILMAGQHGALIGTPKKDAKAPAIPVPFNGFQAALQAMQKAES